MKTIKKQLKRAFTIVELVIVIAVIAALAAILIPTFVNVVNSANESADEQAVKNMNTALIAEEYLSGKPVNPSDAMEIIEDAGYTVKDYVAQLSGNTIYWDSTMNRCLIYNSDEEAVTYPSDAVSKYENTAYTSANIPTFWYTLSKAYVTKVYNSTTATETFAATVASLKAGETLQLQNDVTLKASEYNETSIASLTLGSDTYSNITKLSPFTLLDGEDVTIDLNNHNLTVSYGMLINNGANATYATYLTNGSSLYFKNGTIDVGYSLTGNNGNVAVFNIQDGCALTLENVTVNGTGSFIYPQGNSAQINVINSYITSDGGYCIATNANTSDNWNVVINVESSTLIATGSPICINVPGTCIVNDSTIVSIGGYPGFVARGGTITIDNSKIYNDLSSYVANAYKIWNARMNDFDANSYGYTTYWKSGNGVPYAALCIGNDADSDSYQYPTKCTVTNTEIHANKGYMCVYVEGNNKKDNGATFNYSNCSFYYHDSEVPYYDTSNGTAYANVTPTEYSSSLFDSGNSTNPLNYAIIYTNNTASYVTINGIVYRNGSD